MFTRKTDPLKRQRAINKAYRLALKCYGKGMGEHEMLLEAQRLWNLAKNVKSHKAWKRLKKRQVLYRFASIM
jgi:hypothetical protein